MIHTQCPSCHRLVCLHRHGGEDVLMGIVCPSCVDAMRAEARAAKESEAAAVQRLGELVTRQYNPPAFVLSTDESVRALYAEVLRLRHYIADQSRELMKAEARADAMERAGQEQARRADENQAAMVSARYWEAEYRRLYIVMRDQLADANRALNAVRAAVNP